jgi:glycerol-3-phosphate dehydrogenase
VDVLVIGGGATGAGVVRDAAMRGFSTALVERGDLGSGTTGGFHGLLHSGGRYVATDPEAATDCALENAILRRIAAEAIEDTGGFFVTTPWDDPAFADTFLEACRATGVAADEIDPDEARRQEPLLNPEVTRAFRVPDASIDAWKLVWANARSAEVRGAAILPHHPVTGLARSNGAVAGAIVRDLATGEEHTIEARVTVNATGAWAGQVAAMADCEVHVQAGRGIMIAFNHRFVQTVVNRCALPGDGDIIVPIRSVCVIGTTDEPAADPDVLAMPVEEVQRMLDDADRLVPGLREARALRVWAGARPLYRESGPVTDTRKLSRGFTLLDHGERDGVAGFLTITGGKATTYRRMAEVAVDAVCRHLGEDRPCTTADVPLPGSEDGRYLHLEDRLARRERELHDEQIVCECELVTRGQLLRVAERRPPASLDDLRRMLRLGMGPCQGGFCTYRATGLLHEQGLISAASTNAALVGFLEARFHGLRPLLHGDNLRQSRLDDWIFQGVLDVRHLPT